MLIYSELEIVLTTAAPTFDILFIGCVLNAKIVYTSKPFIDLQMLQDATRRWRSLKVKKQT